MGMGKLKIGGAWGGVLEVDLDEWTVAMLREEVANRSDSVGGPKSINLICAGRVLKDGDGSEKLSQLGVKNNSKILASKVYVDRAGKSIKDEFLAEEERAKRVSRLKAAASKLASRHAADGTLPVGDFDLVLENQSGERVSLGSETDQRAVMMGLMLHANAKALIKREQYRDALEVLLMGEEAYSLCNHESIELVDNEPILQIDLVWCYLMLRDISWLSEAGIRLAKARKAIERCHGKECSRIRVLQGGINPELALHLRMELLEGVIAYHSGQLKKSKEVLTSAQARYLQLRVPDESLSFVMSMGYNAREATRALRLNKLDVGSAVEFLLEEKAREAKMQEINLKIDKEIMELKQYGVTPLKKAVESWKLNELVSIGFQKDLAAEALRRNENDTQKALDDLTDPETITALQNELISRKRKRMQKVKKSGSENHVSMASERASVESAVGVSGSEQIGEGINSLDAADGGSSGEGSSAPNDPDEEERDVEMEEMITKELQFTDTFSDYETEVTKVGEAINEYLALLNSAAEIA